LDVGAGDLVISAASVDRARGVSGGVFFRCDDKATFSVSFANSRKDDVKEDKADFGGLSRVGLLGVVDE